MSDLTYTLLTDGSSDKALIPILDWLLKRLLPECAIQSTFGDLSRAPRRPQGLPERIAMALYLYPCKLFFIHRDAEGQKPEERIREISDAINEAQQSGKIGFQHHVGVVPVRMTEAWLLIDEASLRRAAGNPNGKIQLNLPSLSQLERVLDPKKMLYELLQKASEKTGRRVKDLKVQACVHTLADTITDYEPLRKLQAFQRLERDIKDELKKISLQ